MKICAFLIIGIILQSFISPVVAQTQDFDFSGNNPDSYQCFDGSGQPDTTAVVVKDKLFDVFICDLNSNGTLDGDETRAVLIPPRLQVIEVWFVRIIYVVWALVGAYSFYLLVVLGYQVMISRGDPTSLPKIRQRIINYMIGFALVFLAIPILDTFFRLLGINKTVSCYDVQMPGFQFFFTTLCSGTDPCSFTEDQLNQGIVCPVRGEQRVCSGGFHPVPVTYTCDAEAQIWRQ